MHKIRPMCRSVLFWDDNELNTTLEDGEFGMIDASAA
jgi:hypothetical protein